MSLERLVDLLTDQYKKAEQERDTLAAKLKEVEKALREVEWSGEGEEGAYCLSCGELEADGHADTCLIGQALEGSGPDA